MKEQRAKVIEALNKILEEKREQVSEFTLYLSDSMRKIGYLFFPKANIVIDLNNLNKGK